MRKLTIAFSQLLLFKNAIEQFNTLAEQEKLKINARVSYILHKNQTSIYKVFWQFMEKRNQLIHLYAEKDENGEVKFQLKDEALGEVPENMEVVFADKQAFESDLEKLMEGEYELELFHDNQLHKKLGDMSGEHTLLTKLWELLDIFENYGR